MTNQVLLYPKPPEGLTKTQLYFWKYHHSEKGKESARKWAESPKGIESAKRKLKKYRQTPKGKENMYRNNHSLSGQRRFKKFEFIHREERNLKAREKNKTPEQKLYKKQWNLKNKEKNNEYQKWYSKTPNGIERARRKMQRYVDKLNNFFNLPKEELRYALFNYSDLILDRDNNCMICEQKSQIAHHLIYKKTLPKFTFNMNNGIGLCKLCHNELHYGHKGGLALLL